MHRKRAIPLFAFIGLLLAFLAAAGAAVAAVAQGENAADANTAAALRARYAEIQKQLGENQFGRPLHLVSQEGNKDLKGDVYAVVEHPFSRVDAALNQAANWCDILILPYNTKHCEVKSDGGNQVLTLFVGKKNQDSLDRAYRLDFNFHPVARVSDYLKRVLKSEAGPLGTRDYEITLEAAPLDAQRSFIHLSYSYAYGTISKIAMQTYLGTFGAGKVGFSLDGKSEDGRPQLVSGMRGVMERNTMRYALAIEAYLNSLTAPAQAQLEKRLNDWYTYSEKYPRQLHEMDRGEYIAMKQKDTQRAKAQS
jgi:hypothetical protein